MVRQREDDERVELVCFYTTTENRWYGVVFAAAVEQNGQNDADEGTCTRTLTPKEA